MASPKILEVLEASVGGTRKHVLEILRGLAPSRFELHLACSFARAPDDADAFRALASRWARVIHVPMVRRPAPIADLRALGSLTRLMRAERYDLVHTHAAKAGFLGRRAARRAGVPVVLHTPHTFPFQQVDSRLAWLYRLLERRAARWADRLVLVAESQRHTALEARLCEPERLVVVENGIALPRDEPAALRRRYRDELGLTDATPAIGFVGRITPQKDVQTFLDVAATLMSERPALRAFLVGTTDRPRYLRSLRPPAQREAWQALACGATPAPGTTWSPHLPVRVLGARPDAAELVAAFDVVVLPSRYEGLPYALLEAMACAVPVVASDVTGSHDVLEHEVTGLLAPAGDLHGFVAHVRRLLGHPGLARRLGAAARQRVAESFTQEAFVRRITELYEGELAKARTPRREGH